MTGGVITDNTASGYGGGIYVTDEGSMNLQNVKITYNTSKEDGGGLFLQIKTDSSISNCEIKFNKSTGDTCGGIYMDASGRTLTITNTLIDNNISHDDGAGIYLNRGAIIMSGGSASSNQTDNDGGGICMDDNSTLTLSGGTITGNTAGEEGGGVFVDDDGCTIKVEGCPVVNKNNAVAGYNIYLQDNKVKLIITGPLETAAGKANLGVVVESKNAEVAFTTGYGAHNPGKAPSLYFVSNDGYEVYLQNGEAAFRIPKMIEDGTQFIPKTSQIQTDINQLSSQNWMAGISGERRLNEINLPGSHDSGMRSLYHWSSSTFNLGAIGASYAYTQVRYIDEQMEDGIRKFDVRLNPYHVTKGLGGAFRVAYDDGEHLYLCHGKDEIGGTYYARDHDGSGLRLDDVLDYVKDFLQRHPTEVIILDFGPEVIRNDKDDIKKVEDRLVKYMREFSKEINPSTKKPYLYLEDGIFGKPMTYYPQLKDVRGQVIANSWGGFSWKMSDTIDEYSPEGETKEPAGRRIQRVLDFYQAHPMTALPTDAKTHYDYVYHVKTNSTNQMAQTPLELVDEIHPVLYGDGKTFGMNNAGKYFGYVNMDDANATDARCVWEANFFDGLDYCTVNVESGLDNTDQYPDQSYQLLRYTPITIPQNIYSVDQQTLGKYFAGWRDSNGTLWTPGQTYEHTDDTITFTAEWSSEVTTPVQVIWKDGDNKDEIRPETLTFSINGTANFSLTAGNSWTGLYTGDITSIVPSWDRIRTSSEQPQGQDTTGQYRYEVTGEPVTGYVFTLVHTPQSTVSVSGTVEWNDEDGKEGLRPQSVKLHLLADGRKSRPRQSLQQMTGSTASGISLDTRTEKQSNTPSRKMLSRDTSPQLQALRLPTAERLRWSIFTRKFSGLTETISRIRVPKPSH